MKTRVKLKKLEVWRSIRDEIKNTRPRTKLENVLKLGGIFKALQGWNLIDYWNQNSIQDLIEKIRGLGAEIKKEINDLIQVKTLKQRHFI
jgi:hypothetical protein